MIHELEERLAAWIVYRLRRFGGATGWVGDIYTETGVVNGGQGRMLGGGDILAQLRVNGLSSAEGDGVTAMPNHIGASCSISLQLMGDAKRLQGRSAPDGGKDGFHAVDLAAFALLAGLKEPPAAAPTGAEQPLHPAPAGTIAVQSGPVSAALAWTDLRMVSADVTPLNPSGLRQWDIPLTAACAFRMSPLAADTSFIRETPQSLDVIKPPANS